jgi:hypothetical protein
MDEIYHGYGLGVGRYLQRRITAEWTCGIIIESSVLAHSFIS